MTDFYFAGAKTISIGIAQNDGVQSYTGDGVSFANFWGAQMEVGRLSSYVAPRTAGFSRSRDADIAYVAVPPPQVMLQISRDGGHVYGAELWRSFGRIGKFRARAVWNGLGRARDWTMKFRITDAVKVVFVAVWASYSK